MEILSVCGLLCVAIQFSRIRTPMSRFFGTFHFATEYGGSRKTPPGKIH
jgi:hypothetical protein